MNTPNFELKVLDGINVATVTYDDGTMFTVSDWQSSQPTVNEIEQFEWVRVDPQNPADATQWTPAVMLLGWPRVL